jgi:hypothetical membrane protein
MHVHAATTEDWPAVGIWKRIAEPRVQRVAYFVIYLLQFTAGAALGFVQPRAAEYEFGALITSVWAGFFMLGGLLGAVGVFPGWNFVERVGILSLMIAIGLCTVFIAYNPWSPGGLEVIIWALVAGWAVVLLYRLWEIRDYAIAPK